MIQGVDWEKLSASAERVDALADSGKFTFAAFTQELKIQQDAVKDCDDEEAAGELLTQLYRACNPKWFGGKEQDLPFNPYVKMKKKTAKNGSKKK